MNQVDTAFIIITIKKYFFCLPRHFKIDKGQFSETRIGHSLIEIPDNHLLRGV